MRPPSAMPWPASAVNSGPRRLSPPPRITATYRNSQPTCSTAFCSSPADHPDLQRQAKFERLLIELGKASGLKLINLPEHRPGVVAGGVHLWGRGAEFGRWIEHALHHGGAGHIQPWSDQGTETIASKQHHAELMSTIADQ